MALHRHYIWSLVIKENFIKAGCLAIGTNQSSEHLFFQPYGTYMSIWYAMLYGTLEVLKEKRILVPEIQEDIDDIYEALRLFRNAVIHPQPDYFSPKLGKLGEDPEAAKKIWRISDGLGKFFIGELNRLNSGQKGIYVED